MEYSRAVRQRFERPIAAAPTTDSALTAASSAEDRSLGVWVRFSVAARDDVIVDTAYRAYGCPHLLAACDWTAEWLRGLEVEALRSLPIDRVVAELEVPRAKMGKLLRLEDALLGCAEALAVSRTANGGE